MLTWMFVGLLASTILSFNLLVADPYHATKVEWVKATGLFAGHIAALSALANFIK